MPRILVIEDEPQMLRGLRDNLELEGYEVATATTGEEGLAKAAATRPDLLLLDITLPHKNGFAVCRELRARANTTPIIMLTARSQEADKVHGLGLGADDYITKPFSVAELLARIQAVLRRTAARRWPVDSTVIGDLQIDFRTCQAMRVGRRVDFTARELELLRYLVTRTGEVVTREEVLAEIWGYEASAVTRTLDHFIGRLRQKIEPVPHEPRHLLTVHGLGYKFVG